MTKRDKLIERLLATTGDFGFDELFRVFTLFGYKLDQTGGGSHHLLYNEATGADFHVWKSHGRKENTVPKSDQKKAIRHLKAEGHL